MLGGTAAGGDHHAQLCDLGGTDRVLHQDHARPTARHHRWRRCTACARSCSRPQQPCGSTQHIHAVSDAAAAYPILDANLIRGASDIYGLKTGKAVSELINYAVGLAIRDGLSPLTEMQFRLPFRRHLPICCANRALTVEPNAKSSNWAKDSMLSSNRALASIIAAREPVHDIGVKRPTNVSSTALRSGSPKTQRPGLLTPALFAPQFQRDVRT